MKGCWIRLVNTHLAAAHNETQQNRDKRIIQANQLIQGLECGWDFAILGMDLKHGNTLEIFLKACGLCDFERGSIKFTY